MFNLIEYYIEDEVIKSHIVDHADTIEELDVKKIQLAKVLNDGGIRTLEVIATKNRNSLQQILKEKDTKIFRVVEV